MKIYYGSEGYMDESNTTATAATFTIHFNTYFFAILSCNSGWIDDDDGGKNYFRISLLATKAIEIILNAYITR